jgi:hypothetical protein
MCRTHQQLGGRRPKQPKSCEEKALALAWLCAISARTGWALSTEFFYPRLPERQAGWVASAGLGGTPFDSGQSLHEQGDQARPGTPAFAR